MGASDGLPTKNTSPTLQNPSSFFVIYDLEQCSLRNGLNIRKSVANI